MPWISSPKTISVWCNITLWCTQGTNCKKSDAFCKWVYSMILYTHTRVHYHIFCYLSKIVAILRCFLSNFVQLFKFVVVEWRTFSVSVKGILEKKFWYLYTYCQCKFYLLKWHVLWLMLRIYLENIFYTLLISFLTKCNIILSTQYLWPHFILIHIFESLGVILSLLILLHYYPQNMEPVQISFALCICICYN